MIVIFSVVVVVGVVLGVLGLTVRPIRCVLDLLDNLGPSLPLVSMIPAIILILGLESATVVAVINLDSLPVLIVNTAYGVRKCK